MNFIMKFLKIKFINNIFILFLTFLLKKNKNLLNKILNYVNK